MPELTHTTVGQLLLDQALPSDMRGRAHKLDAKGLQALFQELAEKHPDDYRDSLKHLSDIGREVSYRTGGFSFGLKHLQPSPSALKARREIERKIDAILEQHADPSNARPAIIKMIESYQEPLKKAVYEESLAEQNPLALQILSGSRGNPGGLMRLRAGDLLYQDHRQNVIPFPILHSYSEGLSPAEYFAGTFGARAGVVATKLSTADSGYLAKQLLQATHHLVVSDIDDPDEDKKLPVDRVLRGMPVDTTDPDNEGALLASASGGYPRNTILTPKVIKTLHEKGIKRLIVRSPIVGGSRDGGLYARDVGVRERGGLAPIGDFSGIAAAQALAEPISQGGLSQKHTGGVAGSAKNLTGFQAVKQLLAVPEAYPGGAAHAELDGKVERVKESPTGGTVVTIGGQEHYVHPGFELKVKQGDTVEAGDAISTGLPNPAKIVEHKGIGEGRRYFTDIFRQVLKASGLPGHRRNIELLARGLVDRVELDDEVGHGVPGDLVPYDLLEREWQPRAGMENKKPSASKGHYLETPVLHYTIGTKIRPSTIKQLEEAGIKNVNVNKEPPPFHPVQVRSIDLLQSHPDWMTRMLSSNLQKSFLEASHRGRTSDTKNISFVPSLAEGTDFGKNPPFSGKPGKQAEAIPPATDPSTLSAEDREAYDHGHGATYHLKCGHRTTCRCRHASEFVHHENNTCWGCKARQEHPENYDENGQLRFDFGKEADAVPTPLSSPFSAPVSQPNKQLNEPKPLPITGKPSGPVTGALTKPFGQPPAKPPTPAPTVPATTPATQAQPAPEPAEQVTHPLVNWSAPMAANLGGSMVGQRVLPTRPGLGAGAGSVLGSSLATGVLDAVNQYQNTGQVDAGRAIGSAVSDVPRALPYLLPLGKTMGSSLLGGMTAIPAGLDALDQVGGLPTWMGGSGFGQSRGILQHRRDVADVKNRISWDRPIGSALDTLGLAISKPVSNIRALASEVLPDPAKAYAEHEIGGTQREQAKAIANQEALTRGYEQQQLTATNTGQTPPSSRDYAKQREQQAASQGGAEYREWLWNHRGNNLISTKGEGFPELEKMFLERRLMADRLNRGVDEYGSPINSQEQGYYNQRIRDLGGQIRYWTQRYS